MKRIASTINSIEETANEGESKIPVPKKASCFISAFRKFYAGLIYCVTMLFKQQQIPNKNPMNANIRNETKKDKTGGFKLKLNEFKEGLEKIKKDQLHLNRPS